MVLQSAHRCKFLFMMHNLIQNMINFIPKKRKRKFALHVHDALSHVQSQGKKQRNMHVHQANKGFLLMYIQRNRVLHCQRSCYVADPWTACNEGNRADADDGDDGRWIGSIDPVRPTAMAAPARQRDRGPMHGRKGPSGFRGGCRTRKLAPPSRSRGGRRRRRAPCCTSARRSPP